MTGGDDPYSSKQGYAVLVCLASATAAAGCITGFYRRGRDVHPTAAPPISWLTIGAPAGHRGDLIAGPF